MKKFKEKRMASYALRSNELIQDLYLLFYVI